MKIYRRREMKGLLFDPENLGILIWLMDTICDSAVGRPNIKCQDKFSQVRV